MSLTDSSDPCDFILFGTLGDLSCRKLLPALYQLECNQLLHEDMRIIGCARDELTLSDYLASIRLSIEKFASGTFNETAWTRLAARCSYCSLDLSQPNEYLTLTDYMTAGDRIVISYFAIPPSLYAQVCQGLSIAGLSNKYSRVVLEKPIGQDLPSSIAINKEVAHYFTEDQIYRIDHYLGKETVLNLLVLRFANAIFSTNWDRQNIEKVEITLAEEVGVEGRWNYYDNAGQVRDMLQNHLLQILSLVAMEPPLTLSAENIRSEKLKVLKSLRVINEKNVADHTIRGQYMTHRINNQIIPGYLEEEGAVPHSMTETFVAIKAYVDNWRWSGVPFYLLTGKRLAKKKTEVVIYFKHQPHNIFKELNQELFPNQLHIRLQPDEGIEIRVMNKIPGLGRDMELQESKLDLSFNDLLKNQTIPDAYERLLLEIFQGNQYLFVSRDEIEQAWTWIDGIKNSWKSLDVPLHPYPSGTWGPIATTTLFKSKENIEEQFDACS